MSVNLDDPYAFQRSPYFTGYEYGNFSPFYVAVAICTVFGVFLCCLNIFFCCCSKHKHYWQDSNTGNRWILPIWNKTPHKQPPLDYTELDKSWLPVATEEVRYLPSPRPSPAPTPVPLPAQVSRSGPSEYHELHKIESDI